MRVLFLVLFINLFVAGISFSQSQQINNCLRLIAEGKEESVKSRMPELKKQYGEEPGILLLQGVLQVNAQHAIPYYKQIIEKFPNSEWSPHAYWRLIQYYAMVTDTNTAKSMLMQFRNRFPSSPFLSPASDMVRLSISDAKFQNRINYLNPNPTNTKKVDTDDSNYVATESVIRKEKFGLQVGIFSTLTAAEDEKARFISMKYDTDILEKLVVGERKFAVVIGDYDSEDEAMRAKKLVERGCNCNPLVFKKGTR